MRNPKDDKDDKGTGSELDRRIFGKVVATGVAGLALGGAADAVAKDCKLAAPRPDACPSERPGDHCTADIDQDSSKCGTIFDDKNPPDVIVVGAGLSGLIAARQLVRAGRKVLVLEGNCRIGGRMFGRETISGGYLDLGGQWVGPTQYEMMALVTELGITPFDSYEKGKAVNKFNERRSDFNGDISDLLKGDCQPLDLAGLDAARCKALPLEPCVPNSKEKDVWKERLLKLSATIPADRPWDAVDAANMDNMTFWKWLVDPKGGNATDEYTKWLPTLQSNIGGAGGFEPDQVSALHMAWTQCVSPQSETPEKWLLCGGAGQIPAILARQIKDESKGASCIHTNAGVTTIEQLKQGGVRITMKSKGSERTLKAMAVIVAIPPSLRKCITFVSPADMPMPKEYEDFSKGSPMGSMGKVHAVYPTAFWRDRCLSGSALGNLETCEFVADCSPSGGTPGVLTAFVAANCNANIAGEALKKGQSEEEYVKGLALNDFVKYFGINDADFEKKLRMPLDFVYYNWNTKPWTGGAYTCYLGTNVWTKSAKIGWRTPFHDIFWAGTETADRWPGFFDGAISAGKEAASRVQSELYWTGKLKEGNANGCSQPVLQVGIADDYRDVCTFDRNDCAIYSPRPHEEGFFTLGHWVMPDLYTKPPADYLMVRAVNDDPKWPMLKAPASWKLQSEDRYQQCSFYSAVAPPDYVAIGWVGWWSNDLVTLPYVRCVRKDLVEEAEIGERIWISTGAGAGKDVTLWTIKGMPHLFVGQYVIDWNRPHEDKYAGPKVYKLKHLG